MKKKLHTKIFLPFHIDCGNRGCEGITRGLAYLLNIDRNNINVLTNDIEGDKKAGLNKIVCLHECRFRIGSTFLNMICDYLNKVLKKDVRLMLRFAVFMNEASQKDIVLITGGDLYCYPEIEWQLRWVCWLAKLRGCKLILFGCSIDEERLNSKLINHLKKYDGIYARECLTKKALIDKKIKRVEVIPDPAFHLEPSHCSLPDGFREGMVIGVNISNYTNQGSYSLNTIFGKNILVLFNYILEHSDLQIVLIPHVFWREQDDRVLLRKIYRHYSKNDRIFLLEGEELSYCQIRYVISKCSFFIGSRTHSMISAYAMGIPSLALGYSVKSKGILHDLNISNDLIVDCNRLKEEDEILNKYLYLLKNKKCIQNELKRVIPAYISKR